MMLSLDSVCIYSSADRDHVRAVVERIRLAGIACVLLPSDRAIRAWDVEVATADLAAARAIVDDIGAR
jgi:hypothetical protein